MVKTFTAFSIENMNHQHIQDELSAYLDNELTPSRREEIKAHLHSCDECADMLSAFQANRQRIANIARPAPATLKDTVMAKIHTQFQDELSAYLDNELAPAARERVEAHLHSCDECSDMLSAFQANRQRVASIAHPVPATLKDTVMAKIHTQFQDELSAYLDNELAPAARERIEAHLHSCDECADMLTTFRQNRERVRGIEHPAPVSIENAVMAKIRQQAAKADPKDSTHTPWFSDIGKWLPDVGRWFLRPVTAGATGILTLALIVTVLFRVFPPSDVDLDPTSSTLDFYVGLYTEQVDNPLKSNVGGPLGTTSIVDFSSTESTGDTEPFLDLYLENVGD